VKLTVFQAGKGDCLLLTTNDGKRMLIDGGMRSDYRKHVAPALADLASQGAALDVVYVSHIDRDHIAGVLQLMDDLVDWRHFDFQQERGNTRVKEPKRPRPPEVRQLWHNGFGELLDNDTRPVEDVLAMKAGLLEASVDTTEWADDHRELAESVGEGIELSRRTAADQLGIPLNQDFGGHLALVREAAQLIPFGSVQLTLIGPFSVEVDNLRDEWAAWLDKNAKALTRIRREMQADSDRLATDFDRLRAALDFSDTELGQRENVTVPNLASLMFLAEEGDRTMLLTGDGHHADILKGLEHAGRIQPGGSLHVDVLKVQHHGSEHNLDPAFAKRITADQYIFCANGEHKNPDRRIVQTILDSRAGDDREFELHFNSSSAVTEGDQAHMREIEDLANAAANDSNGRIQCHFLDGSSFDLTV
jgi:hypothetical protein